MWKFVSILFAALLSAAPSPSVAAPVTFTATLLGASESPANASPGTGFATVAFDDIAKTMQVDVIFSGLLGTTTASHIHCCTATPDAGTVGVSTTTPSFPGFALGVSSGIYSNLFDMTLASSYNPSFIATQGGVVAAESALFAGMQAGKAYFNIHTNVFPGGEIRGFLVQQTVPEPSTLALLGLSIAALGVASRRRVGG